MINPELDIARWQRHLREHSWVQIPEFLQPDAAAVLAQCLERDVPWQLAQRSEGTSHTLPRGTDLHGDEVRAMEQRSYARAGSEYQFLYDSYMLVRAAIEGWDPQLPVHVVLPFFNSPEYLHFARILSDDAPIRRINGQCTRYRPGQFLMPHDDGDLQEGRRYAYVLNLTWRWEPDWGGQLQFLDADNTVTRTLLPRWNSLSLFKVPQKHQVTLVSPWAQGPRQAITGWWLDSAPDGIPAR